MGTKDEVRGLKQELDGMAAGIRNEIARTREEFGKAGADTVQKLKGLQGIARELGDVNKELDELLEGSNSAHATAEELSGSPTKADG
jgi:uncharacterized coiled-coil DUF342 family protein